LVSSERTIAVTDRYVGVVIIATLMMPPVLQMHISFLANRIRQMVNNIRQAASGWKRTILARSALLYARAGASRAE
jgi:hypothetical protein